MWATRARARVCRVCIQVCGEVCVVAKIYRRQTDFFSLFFYTTSLGAAPLPPKTSYFSPGGPGFDLIVIRARPMLHAERRVRAASERGILAEPAAHLSADEESGATQVQ